MFGLGSRPESRDRFAPRLIGYRNPAFALRTELGNNDVVKSTTPLSGASARVARVLLEGGPQTAVVVAEHLGLTPTAVRRHLDHLVDSGHAMTSERAPYGPGAGRAVTRGRGRPAKVYTLSAQGRDAFEAAYDDLAVGALRFLRDTGGPESVMAFANHRVAELERRYAAVSQTETLPERVTELVAALSRDGYAASVIDNPIGSSVQICQHHCPVGHVAAEFPALCDAEADAFSRLLGTHVTRLATLAAGDGVCTTLVPVVPTSTRSSERSAPTTARVTTEVLA